MNVMCDVMSNELSPFWVDLHVHTVLSPCAELGMGASEIITRCKDESISVIAVTDHNHVANVPALSHIIGEITVLSGMEVQSMEDIHVILVFPDHDKAVTFKEWLWLKMLPIENNEDVFGFQLIIDHENNIIEKEPVLLVQGAQYSIDEIAERGMNSGALVIPAHMDRPSFSYEAVLGQLPENFPCSAIEISSEATRLAEWKERYPNRAIIRSSDSHKISSISRNRCTLMLLAEPSFNEIKLALQNRRGRKILLP